MIKLQSDDKDVSKQTTEPKAKNAEESLKE